METSVQEGGWYTRPADLPHPTLHPSSSPAPPSNIPLFHPPFPSLHSGTRLPPPEKATRFYRVQSFNYGVTLERLISGPCLWVRHCVVAMTPPQKENQLNLSRMFQKPHSLFSFSSGWLSHHPQTPRCWLFSSWCFSPWIHTAERKQANTCLLIYWWLMCG